MLLCDLCVIVSAGRDRHDDELLEAVHVSLVD